MFLITSLYSVPFFCTVRLISSVTTATFEGFMVEARESSDFFGEGSTMHQEDFDNGSTIWGTWVTDPNQVGSGYSPDDFLYHALSAIGVCIPMKDLLK